MASAVGSPLAMTSTYVVDVMTVLLPLGSVDVMTFSTALEVVTSASVVDSSLVDDGSSRVVDDSSSDVVSVTAAR